MKISVVMPAYNAEVHIKRSLLSLAAQTSREFEVILVDDGSEDGTPAVATRLLRAAEFPSFRVISVPHDGVSSARNRGLAEAAGEYTIFVDSDDYVAYDLIETVSARIRQDWPDLLAWGWDIVDPKGTVLRSYFDVQPAVPRTMTGVEALRRRVIDRSLRIWTASVAYRRDFLLEHAIQFTKGCTCGEDLEFAYMALIRAQRLEFIERTLSFYVDRPASSSNCDDVRRFDSVAALKRVHTNLCTSPNPEVRVIAATFIQTKVLANYFFTLTSCMNFRGEPDVLALLAEVASIHPGLNEEMNDLLRSRLGLGQDVTIDQRLFLLSPVLWWRYTEQAAL